MFRFVTTSNTLSTRNLEVFTSFCSVRNTPRLMSHRMHVIRSDGTSPRAHLLLSRIFICCVPSPRKTILVGLYAPAGLVSEKCAHILLARAEKEAPPRAESTNPRHCCCTVVLRCVLRAGVAGDRPQEVMKKWGRSSGRKLVEWQLGRIFITVVACAENHQERENLVHLRFIGGWKLQKQSNSEKSVFCSKHARDV